MTLEHFRNARPSQPVALYLLVTVLLVASRIRTLALTSLTLEPLTPLYISLGSRVCLFVTLQFSTRQFQIDGHLLSPERTAGLVSRYLVSWVMPLLWRGYRRPLGIDDLGTIDENLHSISTWNTFSPHWSVQAKRARSGATKQPLVWACVHAFGSVLAAPLLPFLISSLVTLARPLIIGETVTFVESYDTLAPMALSKGWGLVGATALTYLVYAISSALAHVATQRSALALRGAFMEALYRKSLVIRVETAREMGAAKASNLMSVDVNAVVQTVQALHSVWTALVMTALGLYIIWTQIGISFVSCDARRGTHVPVGQCRRSCFLLRIASDHHPQGGKHKKWVSKLSMEGAHSQPAGQNRRIEESNLWLRSCATSKPSSCQPTSRPSSPPPSPCGTRR